jgi:hypothetical protein
MHNTLTSGKKKYRSRLVACGLFGSVGGVIKLIREIVLGAGRFGIQMCIVVIPRMPLRGRKRRDSRVESDCHCPEITEPVAKRSQTTKLSGSDSAAVPAICLGDQ